MAENQATKAVKLDKNRLDEAAKRYSSLKSDQVVQRRIAAPPLRNDQRNRAFQ